MRFHSYGGPEVLRFEDAPRPTAGENEVLIRVHAVGVNPLDWKKRSGYLQIEPSQTFPVILGFDVAGVVEAVGAGVTHLAVGDEVYAQPWFGGYAETVAVPAGNAAHKPRTLDFVQAAAMPVAAITAWQALFDVAQLAPGQTVLIHAAAGGVGHLAVQLARWRGARVIGTASTRNLEFLRQLGADEAIDYTATRFEDVLHGIDVVFDSVGGDTQQRSWAVLRPGGILVALAGLQAPVPAEIDVRHHAFRIKRPVHTTLAGVARVVDAGYLRPTIAAVLPFSEASQAHRLVESGHTRGKIVLQVVP
jgi:NADPH:quinone reductase-like Zn-dependent oxidoreductase